MNRKEVEMLERIAIDPKVMVGKPVIRGSRLTVHFILGLLGHGMTIEQILSDIRVGQGGYFGLPSVCPEIS